MNGQANIA